MVVLLKVLACLFALAGLIFYWRMSKRSRTAFSEKEQATWQRVAVATCSIACLGMTSAVLAKNSWIGIVIGAFYGTCFCYLAYLFRRADARRSSQQ